MTDVVEHDPTEEEQQNLGLSSNRPPNAPDTDETKPFTGENPFA